MNENRVVPLRQPDEIDDPLTEILRCGAKRLVQQAVEAEFAAFLARHADLELPDGRQRVVRHGHDPARPIQTGIGPVEVSKPKARDRGATRADERIRYSSSILPKWARRTKSLDVLAGSLSARRFHWRLSGRPDGLARQGCAQSFAFGDRAAEERLGGRLSALASQRSVGARRFYVWADGVYLQARMEPQAECILVLIGATPEGKKELLGLQTGMRESGQSWKELLVDLKARGLWPDRAHGTSAVGDGALAAFEGPGRSLSLDPSPTMLAAQDPERSRQAAEVGSAQRASGSARNLALRKPRCRRRRDDDLRREIRAQVRQGRRLPSQGPRRIVDVLRFPCRALDASADIESDRKRL